MAQIVVFVYSVTLTFDLCSIVCPVILGDMPWTHTHTHTYIHTHTHKVILIVSRNARLITTKTESLRRVAIQIYMV